MLIRLFVNVREENKYLIIIWLIILDNRINRGGGGGGGGINGGGWRKYLNFNDGVEISGRGLKQEFAFKIFRI